MNKQRMFWILTLVAFALQCIAELMLGVSVFNLNFLPDNYWAIFVGVLIVLVLGVGMLGLFHMPKKQVGVTRRCIAAVLSLLIALGCIFVWQATEQVKATINEITVTEPEVPSRAVFVRIDDPATTLEEIKDYPYGITTDYDAESCQNVRLTIEERLATQLRVSEYATPAVMVDALLSGEVDAIILNSGYLSVLEEQEAYEDILTKIRLVEQIPLVERVAPEETQPTEAPTVPTTEPVYVENITNTPFVVYFSGLDYRGQNLTASRSDVNILAVVNPTTKQILLINTPRDYYVPHPHSYSGTRDKLTHLGIYGIECSMKALETLYDVPVTYYAQVNFSGFEALINALGGITVYSGHAFTAYDDFNVPAYIQKGENVLDGREALCFARDRYNQAAGDNDRGKNQMKVIQAVIAKCTSGSTIISNYSEILTSMSGMFKTNLTTEDISLLVKMQLSDMASWNVQSFAVSGIGGSGKTYSMPDFEAYVAYPDEKTVAFASDLIDRVISGEILTEESVKYTP